MDVVALGELDAPRRETLTALVRRADAARDHPPLPEPQFHAVTDTGGELHDGRLILAERHGKLAGFALLTPNRDGSTAIHVVTDPDPDLGHEAGRDLADDLVDAAVAAADAPADAPAAARTDQHPPGPLHLWAMQAGPADDERAERHGFVPERDVVQMRVALPLPAEVRERTKQIATRPFVPGQDDEAWLRVNNRAFEGHPEQGGWTLEQLHERLHVDWVDLEGFLVADDPDGRGLIGFCWTKIHRNRTPVLGEIYVIGVDPAHHGDGLGRALTVAGLSSIAERGIHVGMLYTDATNDPAEGLYRSLGFTVDHVDRSYRRAPDAPPTRTPPPQHRSP